VEIQSIRLDKLHPVATTYRSNNDLDALVLYNKFDGYQLIRKDCLAFAKRIAEEIARNENKKTPEQIKKILENLTVLADGTVSAESEARSRRNPDRSEVGSVSMLNAVSFDPVKYLKYPIIVVLLAGSCAVIYNRFYK